VPEQDSPVAEAERRRRADEVARLESQHLAPGQAGVGRPPDDQQGEHRVLDARTQGRGDRHRQDQRGERQHHVHDPHRHLVEPAAEVAGESAVQRPEDRRHDHDDGGDGERDAAAVEDTREHIPSQAVDAEPMLG
jgi:hypothetical protein